MIEFAEYIETDAVTEEWLRDNRFRYDGQGVWSMLIEPAKPESAITEFCVRVDDSLFIMLKQGTPKKPKQPDDVVVLTSLCPGDITKTRLTGLIEALGGKLNTGKDAKNVLESSK